MKRWFLYLMVTLVVLGVVDYFYLSKLTAPLHLDSIWKIRENKPSGAPVPKGPEVREELLALRQRHHLRPLTEGENGKRARDVANGIYGFATCEVQTLNAARANSLSLEIHKHLDGIVYYVGYASEDHIEKYLTRQKNFHMLVSLEPRGKATLLLEIPVDFVTKCTPSGGSDGSLFDLFVTAIPELQSLRQASNLSLANS